jgi:bidirectional [NiFe] hydrogenase diaphorase subunit
VEIRVEPAPEKTTADKRLKILDASMKRHQFRPEALIEILHQAQELYGYLDPAVLVYVGRALRVPLSRVQGVATFYNFFTLKPAGAHTCVVCMGTACYVKGARQILEALQALHGIGPGETTADRQLSLVTARCLGACGLAPAAVFDGQIAGKVDVDAAVRQVDRWTASHDRAS